MWVIPILGGVVPYWSMRSHAVLTDTNPRIRRHACLYNRTVLGRLLYLPSPSVLICEIRKSDWIISKVFFLNSNENNDSRIGGLGNVRSDWLLGFRKTNNYPCQFSITATPKLGRSYETLIYDFSLFYDLFGQFFDFIWLHLCDWIQLEGWLGSAGTMWYLGFPCPVVLSSSRRLYWLPPRVVAVLQKGQP